MSDESSDSLPSPGFVSVFRNRSLSSPGQEDEGEGGGELEREGGTEGREAGRGGEAAGGEADRGEAAVGEADRGEAVGGEADRGGEAVGRGAESRPLPTGSTAWNMEALLRSRTAPVPVIEFRSEIRGGGIFRLSLIPGRANWVSV